MAIVCGLFPAPAPAQTKTDPDDAVEAYLERRDLTALLAEQLTDRLSRTPGPQRGPIVERLADALAKLIESSTDAPARQAWETRANELVNQAPESQSLSLRMNLLRARYVQAERSAERARVRLADPGELEEAMSVFENVAPLFEKIALHAHQDVLAIEKQEESGRSVNPRLLAQALRKSRRLRSLGMFLAGWSNTYLAEFKSEPRRAREALTQFGWLLNADINEPPTIGKVPKQALRYEHVDRAAVGVAVDNAVVGQGDQALAWLDLVADSDQTPHSVRAQLPGRRATILARLGQWRRLERFIATLRRGKKDTQHDDERDARPAGAGSTEAGVQPPGSAPLPASLSRLIVALAMESDDASSEETRLSLARMAMADLVQRQEIAQVVDLAMRYGTAAIGGDGFVALHVRGLVSYESAQKERRTLQGDADRPASSPAVALSYRRAAGLLRSALRAADAGAFPKAQAATAMLLGMSLYYASGADVKGLDDAIAAFRQSADLASDDRHAADALWMAHRAARRFDQLSENGPDARSTDNSIEDNSSTDARAPAVAKEFTERFPDDPRASVLRVELAAGGSLAPEDAVAILLDTPRQSPAFETARRHAARLLYTLFRRAPADKRDWSALRYADVAEPLLAMDRARAKAGDASSAQLAVVRARRLLEALLSVHAPGAQRAQSALDALDAVVQTGLAGSPPPALEVMFRRLQIALVRDDEADASRLVRALRAPGADDKNRAMYIELADRAFFNHAVGTWRAAELTSDDPPSLKALSRAVVERGLRLLTDLGAHQDNLADPRVVSVRATVAQAAFDLWRATGDRDALELSYRLHKIVLEAEPGDQGSLRRLADLAEAIGDNETALFCWRSLSSGLAPNTGPWFEARVRLIELLAKSDPERARQALRQHLSLRPDLGPEPWASRFRALADKLNVALPNPTPGKPEG